MKLAAIADSHFGARNDSPIFREHFKVYFQEVFFPLLKQKKIKKMIHFGDVWDRRKYVNFVTLNFFRKYFFDPVQEAGIDMDIMLGNHDTTFKDTSEINSVEELCKWYPNIHIFKETTEVDYDGTKVLIVPWINQENSQQSMDMIEKTDAKILFGHLELQGFYMNRSQKAESGISRDVFKKFDRVYSGHYHHQSTEDNITYLGSMFEINFSDYNDPRGVHIWDTKKPETMEFHQNPFKMHHRVYYDDKEKELGALLKKITDKFTGTFVKVFVHNKTNPYYFEKFMEKLFSMNPADIKIEEDISLTDGDENSVIDMAEDTLTILYKYVDGLEIDSDKTKIKEELNTLYNTALNMER